MCVVCFPVFRALVVFLIFFCLPKRISKQKKRGFFCYCSARKKSSSTLLTQFAYQRHALKLLPLLGAIELSYAWGCLLLLQVLVSCLRQKLRRNHGLSFSALIISIVFE